MKNKKTISIIIGVLAVLIISFLFLQLRTNVYGKWVLVQKDRESELSGIDSISLLKRRPTLTLKKDQYIYQDMDAVNTDKGSLSVDKNKKELDLAGTPFYYVLSKSKDTLTLTSDTDTDVRNDVMQSSSESKVVYVKVGSKAYKKAEKIVKKNGELEKARARKERRKKAALERFFLSNEIQGKWHGKSNPTYDDFGYSSHIIKNMTISKKTITGQIYYVIADGLEKSDYKWKLFDFTGNVKNIEGDSQFVPGAKLSFGIKLEGSGKLLKVVREDDLFAVETFAFKNGKLNVEDNGLDGTLDR